MGKLTVNGMARIFIAALLLLVALAGVENVRSDSRATAFVADTGQTDTGSLGVTANLKQVQQIATDATLSDLELEDSDANDIALDPAFDAATTSYIATVDEVVEVLTVTPTKNDDGATIEYLDGIARPLADADDETEEHQVSLDVGANTFKVKVTAEDGNETSTYIVTVTRLADSTLVKNAHLARTGTTQAGIFRSGGIGQRFTSGSHTDGYSLNSVGVYIFSEDFTGAETVTARIHKFNDSNTNALGDLVATLTTPATWTEDAVNVFEAPSDITLDADTEYILNFDSTGDAANDLVFGIAGDDDQTGADGWLIEDTLRTSGNTHGTNSLMIEVRGNAIDPASTDATLSDIDITDSESNDIALSPTFDAATTSYTASVDNDIEVLTVKADRSDAGATVEYLDGSDATLTDADLDTAGRQVSLDVGANTFKVKVTAEDDDTTKTYTVVVTRLTDSLLVTNANVTGVARLSIQLGHGRGGLYGQRITTGNHQYGYTVTSVGIYVTDNNFSGSETITVRIHEFNDSASNDLGTLVATLTTPTLVEGEMNVFEAPADTTLEANTDYIVNFHSTGSLSTDLWLRAVQSGDESGASGWQIEDNYRLSGSLQSFGYAFVTEVRGNASLSNDISLSALALADTGGNAIELTPAFETGITSYTASVGTDTDKVTVTSTATEEGAVVVYQDSSGTALVDADSAEGFQVALSLGNNTIRAHVTALDGKTTGIHKIAVSRAIWQATLTVRDLGSGDLGCANGNTGNLNCTDGNTLTDDDFTYDSTDYDVLAAKVVSGGKLRLNFSDNLTPFAQNLVLHVGSETFDFEAADTEHPQIRYWLNSGLTWTVGSDVELKLTSPPANDVSTLDDLEITDSGGIEVSLDPTFLSDVTDYTAAVDVDVDWITVTPTETDVNAAVEYLDENDAEIPDADDTTDGHQISLGQDANTIKVKVTSTDLTSIETYTVVVTHLDDSLLVKNTHISITHSVHMGDDADGRYGQRFTTGSHTHGYEVTRVGIYVVSEDYSVGETITARIHQV